MSFRRWCEWEKEGKRCRTGSQLRVRIHFNLHTYNVSGSLNAVRRRTLEFGRKIRIQARPRRSRTALAVAENASFSRRKVFDDAEKKKKTRKTWKVKILHTRVQGFPLVR